MKAWGQDIYIFKIGRSSTLTAGRGMWERPGRAEWVWIFILLLSLQKECLVRFWAYRCTVRIYAISCFYCVFRLQWRPCGSRWIRQSTDACRHSWKIWPQDTRMAAITSLFTCCRIFRHLCIVVPIMSLDVVIIVIIPTSKRGWMIISIIPDEAKNSSVFMLDYVCVSNFFKVQSWLKPCILYCFWCVAYLSDISDNLR